MSTEVSAPGKLVLWGEYAVLTGAPAVAMAVSRRARAAFSEAAGKRRWQISTPGLNAEETVTTIPGLIISTSPAPDQPDALLWHALNALKGDVNNLPAGGALVLDSQPFSRRGTKLGLGSSAAVCTALTALLQQLAEVPPDFATAFRAHRSAQNGKGSGLDVAAAFYGGLVCLRASDRAATAIPRVSTYHWPEHLYWRGIWSTQAAATTAHIQRFEDWQANTGSMEPLTQLIEACEALADGFHMTGFSAYIQALLQFDRHAQLGIYTPLHTELHNLAERHQVLYKPCGAGGGDMGIAVSDDPQRLAAFEQAAGANAATSASQPLDLRLAEHGIRNRP